jgi:hypothetical protein
MALTDALVITGVLNSLRTNVLLADGGAFAHDCCEAGAGECAGLRVE